ncbi:DUF4286 family protein [Frankia sp. AgKG'84/4]
MQKGIMLVQSSPVSPEREDEYNAWYDDEHIPDILKVPGFVGARRYRARDAGPINVGPAVPTYVAVYELESENLAETIRTFLEASAAGGIRNSDALALDPLPVVTVYELLSEH